MKRFRSVLIIIAVGIILAELIITDFRTFSLKGSAGNYLVILAMILLIISLVISIKEERRNQSGK